MAATRFSNQHMQAMYEACRMAAADNFSEFYYGAGPIGPRWPRRGAGHRNAYWCGRKGGTNRLWPRNSLAYAAWAAGRDDFREAATRTTT